MRGSLIPWNMAHFQKLIFIDLPTASGGELCRSLIAWDIDNLQEVYLEKYSKVDYKVWAKQAQNQYIGGFPRYLFETLFLILISLLALILTQRKDGELILIVPLLGTFALGALRVLPSLQNIYSCFPWMLMLHLDGSVFCVIMYFI